MCDGVSTIQTVLLECVDIKLSYKHSDLISITQSLWSSSLFVPITEHVKGYQDELFRPLTIKENLNCRMDSKAKHITIAYMYENSLPPIVPPTTLGLETISYNEMIVSSNLQRSLYNKILHSKSIIYL